MLDGVGMCNDESEMEVLGYEIDSGVSPTPRRG